jgi:hypothetical protein
LSGSENESDYDNNQGTSDSYLPSTKFIQIPVNESDELTHTDDLLLGDQNEIILNNDTHIDPRIPDLPIDCVEHQNNKILSTNSPHRANIITSIKPTATLDDSASSNFVAYRKDSLTSRRLLDIRSHLLLNTTLDAT